MIARIANGVRRRVNDFATKNLIHSNFRKERIAAFISIPKNASKTVLDVLELGPNRAHEYTSSLVIFENHQRGVVLAEKYDLTDKFVFCFCRNPYDRCVSWYKYHREIEPYRSLTFEEWVMRELPHHVGKQNETDWKAMALSPLLQCNYTDDCRIDFIGRMESFSQDFRHVVDTLNDHCRARGLRHRFRHRERTVNASRRAQGYDAYYTRATKDKVYALLKRDFDRFGYDK